MKPDNLLTKADIDLLQHANEYNILLPERLLSTIIPTSLNSNFAIVEQLDFHDSIIADEEPYDIFSIPIPDYANEALRQEFNGWQGFFTRTINYVKQAFAAPKHNAYDAWQQELRASARISDQYEDHTHRNSAIQKDTAGQDMTFTSMIEGGLQLCKSGVDYVIDNPGKIFITLLLMQYKVVKAQNTNFIVDESGLDLNNSAELEFKLYNADQQYVQAQDHFIEKRAMTTIDLSSLTSAQGFTMNGVSSSQTGYSVSSAGDVNNDGISDIIVGAYHAAYSNGAAYVIYGTLNNTYTAIDLASLTQAQGFTINGASASNAGNSVSSTGDVNNDGISDIIVGAYNAGNIGAAYVIYGTAGNVYTVINLASLTQAQGFTINGASTYSNTGDSVSAAGDVNHDGISDIIVGAAGTGSNGGNGAVYVIYGTAGNMYTSVNLASLTQAQGFIINGASSSKAGNSVSSAGDVNNDGISDIIVGAYGAGSGNGAAYVIYGTAGNVYTAINLASLPSSQGFTMNGASSSSAGNSVSSAGDVNHDGISDIIVSAYSANSRSGAAYVIYGTVGNGYTTINLASLTQAQGLTMNGASRSYTGSSVSSAGDVNYDGISDIIVGAYDASNYNGAAYVIYGTVGKLYTTINLASLTQAQGFIMNGASNSGAGSSVSSAGDVNHDGIIDIIVGAYGAGGNNNGAAYVIYGSGSSLTSTSTVLSSTSSTTSSTDAPSTSSTTSSTVEPSTSSTTSSTDAPSTSSTTSSTVEPSTSSTTSSTDEPSTSSTTSSIIAPSTSSTTSSTVAPSTSSTTSSTDEPSTSSTTSSTDEPSTSSTTSSTDEPSISSTTSSTDEPSTSSTTSSTDEPSTSSTTSSTVAPSTSSTTSSTVAPSTSSTTSSTDEPSTSSTTSSTDEPSISSTTSSTDEPSTSSTTSSTDEPSTSSTTSSTDEPSTSSTTSSTDEPSTSSTTSSTDEPSTSSTTSSTDAPSTSSITSSTDAPLTSSTTSSTVVPSTSSTTSSTDELLTSSTTSSTVVPSTSSTTSSTDELLTSSTTLIIDELSTSGVVIEQPSTTTTDVTTTIAQLITTIMNTPVNEDASTNHNAAIIGGTIGGVAGLSLIALGVAGGIKLFNNHVESDTGVEMGAV